MSLDMKEGQKDLYKLARQRWIDILTDEKSVLRRWKELIVVKHEREEGRWIKAGKSRSAEH